MLPPWFETLPDAKDVSALPSVAFADVTNRLLPIHTKVATYLSAVCAFVSDHPGETWKGRLKSACHAFDLNTHVKAAHDVLRKPEVAKEAAAAEPRKYAMELVIEPGGQPVGFYPITTASQLEESALKMANDIEQEKLPASWFCEGAQALLKAAETLNVPTYLIPNTVQRVGVSRLPSGEFLHEQIDKRAAAYQLDAVVTEIYKEAVAGVLAGEMSVADGAYVWEVADRRFQVKYASGVYAPLDAFRSGRTLEMLRKEASTAVVINGVMVPLLQLQQLPGKLAASSFEKQAAAAVLAAMTQEDGVAATEKLAALQAEDHVLLLKLLVSAHEHAAA